MQILVSAPWRRCVLAASVAVLLAACGQKGPLFLPAGEASAGRATLTETLVPSTVVLPSTAASAPATTGRASPVRNP